MQKQFQDIDDTQFQQFYDIAVKPYVEDIVGAVGKKETDYLLNIFLAPRYDDISLDSNMGILVLCRETQGVEDLHKDIESHIDRFISAC